MLHNRYIYVLLLLGMTLLCAGCHWADPEGPEDTGDGIGFDAGVCLLTRSTLITGTTFSNGQHFKVFGRRTGEGKNSVLFGADGTDVTLDTAPDPDVWNYSPKQYWYWVNHNNHYDFLASYGEPAVSDASKNTARMNIPGNLAIEKKYELADDYDLLMAGLRRRGDASQRSAKVPLLFHHMLCAVKVKVVNESESTNFTLNDITFHHLIFAAKAKATFDALGEPDFLWIDTKRSTGSESDATVFSGSQLLSTSDRTYEPSAYTLLIPADLNETVNGTPTPVFEDYIDADEYTAAAKAVLPYMSVTFTVAGALESETHDILLKDIQKQRFSSDDPISEWEQGYRYEYTIGVRLDGGVIVTVVTTEWDDIIAETPGILIE